MEQSHSNMLFWHGREGEALPHLLKVLAVHNDPIRLLGTKPFNWEIS